MKDYTKVCWYCGSKKVFPIKSWWECKDCGATHVPSTSPSYLPITEVDAVTGGAPRFGRETVYRPSGHAQRAATRAREEARAKDNANADSKS